MRNKNLLYTLTAAVLITGWSVLNDFTFKKEGPEEPKSIYESRLDEDFRNDLEEKVESFASRSYRDDGLKEYILSWVNKDEDAWQVTYLGNLDDGIDTEPIDIVTINEHEPMQCASMVKPYVALAYFEQVSNGNKNYGHRIRNEMESMIQWSSNRATNRLMESLGGPDGVQNILEKNYGSMFDDTKIVEKIPKNGRTYENVSSADDYSDFLSALWNHELPYSDEILRIMNLPNSWDDRVFDNVPEIPANGTKVYDKTGTTAKSIGNIGILQVTDKDGNRHAYSFVGVYDRQGRMGYWCKDKKENIRDVSGIVYRGLEDKLNSK